MKGKIFQGLLKTRNFISSRLSRESAWEEIEEILVQADMGVRTVEFLMEKLKKRKKIEMKQTLKEEILSLFPSLERNPILSPVPPTVLLMVGVNGVGKTTTIGKLAYSFIKEGKKVLLSASDTFRAAAIEQLAFIAQKVGADMVKHQYGADPTAVTFDALQSALARGYDFLIIDTAGRMHSDRNLMEELKKIKRVLSTKFNYSSSPPPQEILMVLDAHVGQNSFHQVHVFHDALDLTGIVLAKLDGTAKGGIILQIERELGIPVKWVGVGEKWDDLVKFSPQEYVESIF
ncbi:signal recognition particle-docking protein FtsY [Candidatus Calescamantes bacterium]|nr:signal recognition particle-docking protein FtsY [Candidatus Calescamantes bacterium]